MHNIICQHTKCMARKAFPRDTKAVGIVITDTSVATNELNICTFITFA